MTYVRDWEPLADALKRVIASGVTEDQAKMDICGAVADGKIAVRVTIAQSRYDRGGQVYSGGNVAVPAHLSPADLDWLNSRPLRPWAIGPMPGQHYTWIGGWEKYPIDLVELSTADIMSILNITVARATNAIRSSSKSGRGAKARAIDEAINQLWPDEIPKGLSAKDRNRAILDQIRKNGGSIPADPERAIQRALKTGHVQ